MILFLHIGVALLSLVFAVYVFMKPSKKKLNVSYSLIGLTFGTGIILVIAAPAHMTHACMAGLFYTCLILTASIVTHRKLVSSSQAVNSK